MELESNITKDVTVIDAAVAFCHKNISANYRAAQKTRTTTTEFIFQVFDRRIIYEFRCTHRNAKKRVRE